MNKLKVASKRARPLMGTFTEITLFTEGDFDEVITRAFDVGERLEKTFNIHDPNSELSLLNKSTGDDTSEISPALAEVLSRAENLAEISEGAFNPWREDSDDWDLSGIAKGYIVDKMVESLQEQRPELRGMVNAGGDLRFFNCPQKKISLRLGSAEAPVLRDLMLGRDAIATSSPSISLADEKSSTRYHKPPRKGLSHQHTVSVVADDCMTADALTKVGLFGSPEVVQKCASVLNAQVIIFDEAGEPIEVFEKHEAQ